MSNTYLKKINILWKLTNQKENEYKHTSSQNTYVGCGTDNPNVTHISYKGK